MPARGLRSVRTSARGRASALVVAGLLAVAVAPPRAVLAAVATPTAVAVAPTCLPPGPSARVVILGAGWPDRPVTLTREARSGTTNLGTVTPRPSPAREIAGSFSVTATVPADGSFRIRAASDELVRTTDVTVQGGCPVQISVEPPCLTTSGPVKVSGTGFPPDSEVPVDVDPFGNGERQPLSAPTDKAGAFTITIDLTFTGATIPIVATRFSRATTAVVPPVRAVAFVDPCPPPSTTTTTRPTPPGATTTTTAGGGGATTTTGAPPPRDAPPGVPPVTVPGPGASVEVSISPYTVRPGRCSVLVFSAAPAAVPVVALFADGTPVSGATGPDGRAVLSICHPHDSGLRIGPVQVLVGVGPAAPTPVFTVLRVPARPQPPLLQPGVDGRRS